MNRTRLVFFFIIATAVFIVWALTNYTPEQPGKSTQAQPPGGFDTKVPTGSVLLTVASSNAKYKWIEQVAKKFMAEGKTTRNGAKIVIKPTLVYSGSSMDAIFEGKLKPVVWSPGTDSWSEQLNQKWAQTNNTALMSKACQPVISTPMGIAMWRPMAEALGWPNKPISWKTLVELAADPNGWSRYGHSEWGKFRLGHAHPKYTNSGLLTVASFVYGISGKKEGLTPKQVYDPKVETALRTLAQNTSKYGVATEDLLNLMAKQGPRYLHAAAAYESDTITTNMERSKELRFPLAFIFLAEGTFWGNNPYCILDQATWVTPEQVEAATLFYEFLLKREQQALGIDFILRPLDNTIALHAPLDLANGTDPRVTPETVPPQALPNAELSAAMIDLFMITKRKATVILALDISGSMQGEKIRTATAATVSFLKRLDADDVAGVLMFNQTVSRLAEPARMGDTGEGMANQVNNLVAAGSTALYDAVCQATALVEKLRVADTAAGKNRLYGIVLLSDGDDTVGRPTENQMFTTCLPAQAEAEDTKIFSIAFGNDANGNLLKRIADTTGGYMFTATPESIDKVYLKISAEQ